MLSRLTTRVANIRKKSKSKVVKRMGILSQLKGKGIMGTSKLSVGTIAPYSLGGLHNG